MTSTFTHSSVTYTHSSFTQHCHTQLFYTHTHTFVTRTRTHTHNFFTYYSFPPSFRPMPFLFPAFPISFSSAPSAHQHHQHHQHHQTYSPLLAQFLTHCSFTTPSFFSAFPAELAFDPYPLASTLLTYNLPRFLLVDTLPLLPLASAQVLAFKAIASSPLQCPHLS